MREWKPQHFLPRVVTGRALLSRRQHRDLLAAPNFRHDIGLPQQPRPNLTVGPAPIWPIAGGTKKAICSPRLEQLASPRVGDTTQPTSVVEIGSVSRSALKARPSARIVEMSHPKVTYMVGLTVEMQDSLGGPFKERMRSRIVDTLGTSYAELALGPRASDMRQFYQQQDTQMPFEPFPGGPGAPGGPVGPAGPGSGTGLSQSTPRSRSREERQQWEAERSRPKRDFTVYQRVPERKSVPYKRLLPRLEVLSTPSERYRTKSEDNAWDPYKASLREGEDCGGPGEIGEVGSSEIIPPR
ncbi:Testicular haploid expressed gene protein [Frankliniella fusca]|uniref:Testicular haploid expressed gene protein n=1 Tax=Frankliniella fusca TaxID=407009 RepID=A0AAE1LGC2_9NEOP|nr:Testicular haploid expressed gene protein [Frankliniella fusca]